MAIRPLQVKVTTEGAGKARAEIVGVGDATEQAGNKAERGSQGLAKFGGTLAGLGIGAAIVGIARMGIELGKLEAQIINVEQSTEKGRQRFQELRKTAAELNLSVGETTEAYTRLRRQGLQPTMTTMVGLANLAAATGGQMESVAQAAVNAALGRTQQLAQLGVAVRENGNNLVLTYRGAEHEVGRSAENIIAALEEIGNTQHMGAAAQQAGQLGGELSRLGDAWTDFVDAVRTSVIFDVLTDLTGMVAKLVEDVAWLTRELSTPTQVTALSVLGKQAAEAEERIAALRAEQDRLNRALQDTERVALVSGPGAVDRMRQQLEAVNQELQDQENLWRNIARAMQVGVGQQSAAGAESKTNAEQASQAIGQLVQRLREQAATYGMSREQILRHTAAQALATTGTAEQRKELEQLVEVVARQIRADERRAELERIRADNAKEDVARRRELIKAEEDLTKAYEDQARELDDLQKRYTALLERLDPAKREAREMTEAQDLLTAAFHAGEIGLTEYLNLLAQLPEALGHGAAESKKAAEEFSEQWQTMLPQLEDAFAGLFAQIVGDGKASLDELSQFFGRWLAEMARTAAQQRIAVNMSGGADGGGAGGGFAAAGGWGGLFSAGASATTGRTSAALSGAATGAMIGSVIPVIGTVIGAVLGALIGGLFFKNPRLNVSGSGEGSQQVSTPFGTVGIGGRKVPLDDVADAIRALDETLASLLRPDEFGPVSDALRQVNYSASGGSISVEEMLSQRLNAALAAIEPQWMAFLSRFGELEDRLAAFAGLRNIRDQVEDLDHIIYSFATDPLEQFREELRRMNAAVDETGAALAAAIEAQDPMRIAEAGQAATQAVIQRYQAEVQAVQGLLAVIDQLHLAMEDLEARGQAFNLAMAQRIAGVGGGWGLAVGVAGEQMGTFRGRVSDTGFGLEQRLEYLDSFVATVDAWLQATRAQVEAWRAEAEAAVNAQLSALAGERDAIMAAGAARAASANAAAQGASNAANEAHQAAIRALQEQLRLAQAWYAVLQHVEGIIEGMRFGEASPLSGFSRLDLLDQRIAAAQAEAGGLTGTERSDALRRLADLLQQRMALVMQEGLFDRPSDPFLALYNDTLSQLGDIQEEAQSESAQMIALQEEIAALQAQTVGAVNSLAGTNIILSSEEQRRLREIADEEAELQEELQRIQAEAAERLADIDDTARGYYEWAMETGEQLRAARQEELMEELFRMEELLYEVTGGLDPLVFIADRQALAASLLEDIRDDLRAFLEAISGAVFGGGPGGGGYVAPPGGGGGGIIGAGQAVNIEIEVNGVNDPAAVRGAVNEAIRASLPGIASAVKGEMYSA